MTRRAAVRRRASQSSDDIAAFVGDPIFAVKDTTARKYTGKEFPWRSPEGSVTLVIEVERAKFAHLPCTHAPSP